MGLLDHARQLVSRFERLEVPAVREAAYRRRREGRHFDQAPARVLDLILPCRGAAADHEGYVRPSVQFGVQHLGRTGALIAVQLIEGVDQQVVLLLCCFLISHLISLSEL